VPWEHPAYDYIDCRRDLNAHKDSHAHTNPNEDAHPHENSYADHYADAGR
jgi:hypothetical protein